MSKNKRKAKHVSVEELQAVIASKFKKKEIELEGEEGFTLYELLDIAPKLTKDVAKITFDFENSTMEPDGFADFVALNGWHEVEEFSFLGITAGGDWEIPVFFIVYLDPQNALRGYVPTKGNPFNPQSKCAFGNDEELDEAEAKKQGFGSYEEFYEEVNYDTDAMIEDILNRIEVI